MNTTVLKKYTAICGPIACVINGNMKALRLSDIPPTRRLRFYIMICAGRTSNSKNDTMENKSYPGYCL